MEIKKRWGYSEIGSDHNRPLDQVQRNTRYVATKAQGLGEKYKFEFPPA